MYNGTDEVLSISDSERVETEGPDVSAADLTPARSVSPSAKAIMRRPKGRPHADYAALYKKRLTPNCPCAPVLVFFGFTGFGQGQVGG